jgi:LacI family transcriptional regulator
MGKESDTGPKTARRAMKLADVAEAAGVSLATASRALFPRARSAPEPVREHVQRVAVDLGYVPNVLASSLAAGATTTVGLLVHDLSDPYYAEVAAGAVSEADGANLVTLMITTQWEPARVFAALSSLRSQRVRALVLAGSGFADSDYRRALRREVRALRDAGIGVSSISDHGVPMDMVLPDNRGGAADLARMLVDLGHRRIAIVGGRRHVVTMDDRVTGFREALAEAGIELNDDDVVHTDSTRECAYEATADLANRKNRPTAIFAVTDMLAVSVLGALYDLGVRVPDEISVAGFTDVAPLHEVRPALTTVRLPLQEMGRAAVELAISGKAKRQRKLTVPAEVVQRATTRRLPRAR